MNFAFGKLRERQSEALPPPVVNPGLKTFSNLLSLPAKTPSLSHASL